MTIRSTRRRKRWTICAGPAESHTKAPLSREAPRSGTSTRVRLMQVRLANLSYGRNLYPALCTV